MFKNGVFMLVSPDENDLVTFRIRESDGQVLDVNAPDAERSGGRLIYSDNPQVSPESETFAWGDDLFVMWRSIVGGQGAYVGARVDAETGRRVDGSTTTFEALVTDDNLGYPVYLSPSGGMVMLHGVGTPLSVQDGSPPVITPVPAAAKPCP